MADTGTSIAQLIGQLKTSNANLPAAMSAVSGRENGGENRSIVVNVNAAPATTHQDTQTEIANQEVVNSLDKIYGVLIQQLNFDRRTEQERDMELQVKPQDFQKQMAESQKQVVTAVRESKKEDSSVMSTIGGLVGAIGSFIPKMGGLISAIGGFAPAIATLVAAVAGFKAISSALSWAAEKLGSSSISPGLGGFYPNAPSQEFSNPMSEEEFAQNRISKTLGGESARISSKADSKPMSEEEFTQSRTPKIRDKMGIKGSGIAEYLQETESSNLQKSMGISKEQYDVFRGSIAKIESPSYSKTGGSSGRFSGAYQMGASEIKESAKALGISPPTREEFLKNPQLQEKLFDKYTEGHHKQLLKNEKYASMSKEEQLKVLGYAHNQGAGGASKWLKTGVVGKDAFGTEGTKYYESIGKNLSALEKGEIKIDYANKQNPVTAESNKNESTVTKDLGSYKMVDSPHLRIKGGLGGQATKGGESQQGTMDLARTLQARENELPGGLNRFTAFNDEYHHKENPKSTHTKGLATDITINDAKKSTEAAEYIKNHLIESGLSEKDFNIIDEYKNPSKNSTGGHIHVNFSNKKAAESYANYVNENSETKLADNKKDSYTKLEKELPEGKGYDEEESEQEEMDEQILNDPTSELNQSSLSKDTSIIDAAFSKLKGEANAEGMAGFGGLATILGGLTTKTKEEQQTASKQNSFLPTELNQLLPQQNFGSQTQQQNNSLGSFGNIFSTAGTMSGGISSIMSGIAGMKGGDTRGIINSVNGMLGMGMGTFGGMGGNYPGRSGVDGSGMPNRREDGFGFGIPGITGLPGMIGMGGIGNGTSGTLGGLGSILGGVGGMLGGFGMGGAGGVMGGLGRVLGGVGGMMGGGMLGGLGSVLGGFGGNYPGRSGVDGSGMPNRREDVFGIPGMMGSIGGMGGMLGNTFGGPLGGLIGSAGGGALGGLVNSISSGGGIGDAVSGFLGGALGSTGGVGGILGSLGVTGFGGGFNPTVSKEGTGQYPGREGGNGSSLDKMMMKNLGIQREEGFPTMGGMGKEEYLKRQANGETFDPITGAGSGGTSTPIKPRSMTDIGEGLEGLGKIGSDIGGSILGGIGNMFGFGGSSGIASKGIGDDVASMKQQYDGGSSGSMLESLGVSGIGGALGTSSLMSEGSSMMGGALDGLQSSFSSMMGTGGSDGGESASGGGGSSMAVGNAGGGGGSGGGSPGFKSGDQRAGSSSGAMGIQMGVRNEESILQKAQYSVIRIV